MRFVSLFSGFGGLDLGLERAGMRCVLQVEIEPYAQRVLQLHFPNTPKHGDIRTLQELPEHDLLAGGFPCQDVSIAGKKVGIEQGERSGLWREFLRLVRMGRPRYVLIENVSGLLTARRGSPSGMSRVLTDLTESGYDAEWETIPAEAFGAPHRRERLFVIAYPNGKRSCRVFSGPLPSGIRYPLWGKPEKKIKEVVLPGDRLAQLETRLGEPSVFGTPDGLPYWMERLTGLGNAVVPQVAEWVGRLILEHAGET